MFKALGTWLSGKDPNKDARRAEMKEQTRLNKEAKRLNNYNEESHEADIKNYAAMRDYRFDTAVTNWEYGKRIQDQQHAQSLAVYEKSEELFADTEDFNSKSAAAAFQDQAAAIEDLRLSQALQREAMHEDLMGEIKRGGIQKLEQKSKLYGIQSNRRISNESIQQNLNELTKQNTFEKEAKFIEGLQKSGKAALGQAGVSRTKTLQSTAAESFRSLVKLNSELSGARNKAGVELLKVYVDASLGETQVGLNLDTIELGINSAKEEVKYNNKILDANLKSFMSQAGRNSQQILLARRQAQIQAEANRNLFPEKFDYAPEPVKEPERIFVEPMKNVARTVPKGPRVATGVEAAFDIVGEVAEAATMVMGGIGTFNKVFGVAKGMSGLGAAAAGGGLSSSTLSQIASYASDSPNLLP